MVLADMKLVVLGGSMLLVLNRTNDFGKGSVKLLKKHVSAKKILHTD